VKEIEIIYLRWPVHPDIRLIQTGPGVAKIVHEGGSYWVYGSPDGPLNGKRIEIPAENVAAIQWRVEEAS
jgi:hypothetical protein